jgi:integrase
MPRVSLTDRFVSSARSDGAPQTDYFDEKTPGLALRVSNRGRRSWTFLFTSPKDQKRARATLGTYPATSLAAARTRAIEAREHLEAGRDPRDVFADQHAGAMTLTQLATSYFEKHVAGLRTAKAIERRFQRNILPVIGNVRVADLHRRDVNRVIDPVLKRGRATEAARVFEDLRAMLRWGLARGDLDSNVMDGMQKPAGSKLRDRCLSDDEIRVLWNALPVALAKSISAQRILQLCLLTGQRVGEICGISRTELDLKRGKWLIPGARTKNAHEHHVPLSAGVLAIIAEALTDAGAADFVFPNAAGTGPLDPHVISTALRRAQGRFGMAHWTAHDLRRTAATGLAALGTAPIVIGHILNHRTTTKAGTTFATYVHHTYEREKREALNLWAARIEALVSDDQAAAVLQFSKLGGTAA